MQVLRLCAEAGLVKVGVVALDGTKVKANASLSANRTYEAIREEVQKMLSEAKARDAEEGRLFGGGYRGDELPEELRDPRSRLARLMAAKARLEKEAAGAPLAQEAKISAARRRKRRQVRRSVAASPRILIPPRTGKRRRT